MAPWPGTEGAARSHRVHAGLQHRRLRLQPGQVAADEAAQEGDVGVGSTRGGPVPILGVNGAAVVVAHLGTAAQWGQTGGENAVPPPPCPAHLDQPGVLEGRQPVDAVGSLGQPQSHEAGGGRACAVAAGLLLPPVAHVDAQGLRGGDTGSAVPTATPPRGATNPHLQRQAEAQRCQHGTGPGSGRDDEPGGSVHPAGGGDGEHSTGLDAQHLLPVAQRAPVPAKHLLGAGSRRWLRGWRWGHPPLSPVPVPRGGTHLHCPQRPVCPEHPAAAVPQGHVPGTGPEAGEAPCQRRGVEGVTGPRAAPAALQLRVTRRPQHHQPRPPASPPPR